MLQQHTQRLFRAWSWRDRLARCVQQEPLIETRPSLAALGRLDRRRPPRAVFLGIGLCSPTQLGVAMPVDVVGQLVPAARIRRAIGAESIIALIADRHALANRLDPRGVRAWADHVERLLRRLRTVLALPGLEIVRASDLHGTREYLDVLAEVTARAPVGEHAYRRMQIADGAYLHRTRGGVIKIGWCIDRAAPAHARRACRRDEIAFDRCSARWLGDSIGFVYCKPGRTLSDRRRKAPPYLAVDRAARVCLAPDEDVAGKLARAHASRATVNGYRNHLRAIMYTVQRHLRAVLPARGSSRGLLRGPIHGPIEQRVQQLVARACEPAPAPTLALGAG